MNLCCWSYRDGHLFVRVALFAILCAVPAVATTAWGQDYPRKVVRLIVPFAPGGQVDAVARFTASRLSIAFGRQVLVDNRPGAGGNLGTEIATRAEPDGHTLIMVSSSYAINPALHSTSPYDPRKSFAPVHLVVTAPNVLLVHPSLPAKSVKQLIAFARTQPGRIPYASSGIGTPPHLAAELFSATAGIRLVHVPYKGGGAAVVDLVSGQVGIMFLGIAPAMPHIRAGRLRTLATTGRARARALPEIPTVAETGLTGFEITNWVGLLTPAGTPQSVIDRLHREFAAIGVSRETRDYFDKLGLESAGIGPDPFAKFINAELEKWARVVKASGARVD